MNRFDAVFNSPSKLAAALQEIELSRDERDALGVLYGSRTGLPIEIDVRNRPQGPTIRQCSVVGTRLTRHLGDGPKYGMSWFGLVKTSSAGDFWILRPEMRSAISLLNWFSSATEAHSRHQVGDGEEELKSLPDIEFEAIEGEQRLVMHLHRERSQVLVSRKRESARNADGSLSCEGCGANSREAYPHLGFDLWEVHHRTALSQAGEQVNGLEELAILCPSCHRAIHHIKPMPSVDDFRKAHVAPGDGAKDGHER